MDSIPRPPARSSWQNGAVVVIAAIVLAVGGYYAGRANLIPVSASGTPTPSATVPDAWVGVWFRQKDTGDGFELPALEFRKNGRGLIGRLITPGRETDIGHEVEELTSGEDGLTFVNIADDGRIKYRLVRTGPDSAELQTMPDAAHDLNDYLGISNTRTSSHSQAKREKALQNLNAPRPPERVARLVRVSHNPTPTRTPVAPPAQVAPDAPLQKPPR